jgi:hypothetical protein
MRCLMLGIAVAVTSLMPTLGMADDQQIADYIKSRLQVEQQNGNLRGFNVDMRVDKGTVWFKGHVSNSTQEMTILQAAQQAGHLGVVQVVDDIEVQAAQSVMDRVAAPMPMQAKPQFQNAAYQQNGQDQNPYRQTSSQEMIQASTASAGMMTSGGAPMAFANAGRPAGAPMGVPAGMGGQPPMGGQPMGMDPSAMATGYMNGQPPMPSSYGGATGPSEAPNLPGYAWPGYAASPNYSAVNYPKQYSPSAWPYIGPFYPYPQVPLGWRKVTLEWDDGWWQLDFNDK